MVVDLNYHTLKKQTLTNTPKLNIYNKGNQQVKYNIFFIKILNLFPWVKSILKLYL